MSRYIDADKFKRMYREQLNCVFLALQKSLGEAIDNVPTADVRPNVHGEWLPKWSEFFKRTLPYCSRCLQGFFFETDFCPNCGADMRKGEKDDKGRSD